MRLLLPFANTLKETSWRRAENASNPKQGFQIHMALAALELLPMAWREAAVPSHILLAPVSAFSKSAKAESKSLKELIVRARFVSRLHILGLGRYEQNNHEQDSCFLRNLMTRRKAGLGRQELPGPAVVSLFGMPGNRRFRSRFSRDGSGL
jgi:hypothetical protein